MAKAASAYFQAVIHSLSIGAMASGKQGPRKAGTLPFSKP